MTDVFISYAHEDQNFARRMVPALEAEGFTVWWDHTIPPGQTWDTFIARGIEDARCCIVLWSGRSVGSDWVKEEATLAKDANKLIPVQLDAENPPVGFRRIQAAQLIGWNGDVQNKQWKMLVQEVRRIVGASRASSSPATRPAEPYPAQSLYTPAPEPRKSLPWALIGMGAALLLAVAAFLLLRPSSEPAPPADTTVAAATTTATTSAEASELERLRRESEQTRAQSAAEIERLRRERADAEARAQSAREALERQTTRQQQQQQQVASIVGLWTVTIHSDSGSSATASLRFESNGRFADPSVNDGGTWQQNGAAIYFQFEAFGRTAFTGTLSGRRVTGTYRNNDGDSGTFEMTR